MEKNKFNTYYTWEYDKMSLLFFLRMKLWKKSTRISVQFDMCFPDIQEKMRLVEPLLDPKN